MSNCYNGAENPDKKKAVEREDATIRIYLGVFF